MESRRQVPKRTTDAKSSAGGWPKQPNTGRTNVTPASPESPQKGSDVRDLGLDSTNLGHDPESPSGPLGHIDNYLSSLVEVSERDPQSPRDDYESVEISSVEIQHSPQSLAYFMASPVDHLFAESLLDDIASWEKGLLLHCTWALFPLGF